MDTNFIYFFIGLVLTAVISFFIGKYFYDKQQEWNEDATRTIPIQINQEIGEIRGNIPIIGYVNNINQTTYLTQEIIKKTPTVIKKDGGLFKKGVTNPIPSKRKSEINEIKFSVLRREIGKNLGQYAWLDDDFKNALISVESFYSSDAKLDNTDKSRSELMYIKKMIDLHGQNRLVHLIIPRIRYIDSLETEDKEKWNLLESYYNSLNSEGILIYPSNTDIGKTADFMTFDKVEQNVKDLIIEARGQYYPKKAVDIANLFLKNNFLWDVRRIDFSTQKFENKNDDDRLIIKSKLWIELYDWKYYGMNQYDIKLNKKTKVDYLNYLDKALINVSKPDYLSKSEYMQKLIEMYHEIEQKLEYENFAILKGVGENIGHCLRIATSFKYKHPNLDYISFIDQEDNSAIYFIFSNENIDNHYQKFKLEKIITS